MKQSLKCIRAAFAGALCIFCCMTTIAFAEPVAQGTEGDELQIAEAQQLEIQLGTEWTGVEFVLKTDA